MGRTSRPLWWRAVWAHTALELRLTLRNGEQLLLSMIIPLLLLVTLSVVSVVDVGVTGRAAQLQVAVPGVVALAIMSTAFTSQAIATGFERRYGALRRLAVSPLGRDGLFTAKTMSVLAVIAIQLVMLCATATTLGWRPGLSSALTMFVTVCMGVAAFSGMGLLLAGVLRAEATLAAANVLYVLLVMVGGMVVPLSRYPAAFRGFLVLLPSAALSQGLRGVAPWEALTVLAAWAILAIAGARRYFRWD
jgi:ABC-2 type transport system permease protein